METFRTYLIAGLLAASWIGISAWTLSEVSKVRTAMDTVAAQQQQKVTPVYEVPVAQRHGMPGSPTAP